MKIDISNETNAIEKFERRILSKKSDKNNFIVPPIKIIGMVPIMIDLNNVAYRPLVGNGVSRDTQIITNVQNRDVDGRKDMILTEAGLEIQLPETHTVLQFS